MNSIADKLVDLIDGHMPLDDEEREVIRKYAADLIGNQTVVVSKDSDEVFGPFDSMDEAIQWGATNLRIPWFAAQVLPF